MIPTRFGATPRWLLGGYHPPRASVARDSSVVLCPPVGQEYMRTHRALRQLANELAAQGHHVLRFDYAGTGDSAGDVRDAPVDDWLADIGRAQAELLEISNATRTTLIGLRLGATLAAEALACGTATAQQLVLWDPVVRGPDFLANLDALHAGLAKQRARPPLLTDERMGFPFPPRLRQSIAALDLARSLARLKDTRVALVVSEDLPAYRTLPGVLVRHVPDAGDWDALAETFDALLAARIVQAVADSCGAPA